MPPTHDHEAPHLDNEWRRRSPGNRRHSVILGRSRVWTPVLRMAGSGWRGWRACAHSIASEVTTWRSIRPARLTSPTYRMRASSCCMWRACPHGRGGACVVRPPHPAERWLFDDSIEPRVCVCVWCDEREREARRGVKCAVSRAGPRLYDLDTCHAVTCPCRSGWLVRRLPIVRSICLCTAHRTSH